MNKKELIEQIAVKTGNTKKTSEEVLNGAIEAITEALAKGEAVQLIGFGTFQTKERKAREGRNPRKPEETIHTPARTVPVFKAGKSLKDAVK